MFDVIADERGAFAMVTAHVLLRKAQQVIVLEDVLFGLGTVAAQERRLSVERLVQDDADRPLVAATVIVLTADDLGRHVLAGADDAASEQAFAGAVLVGDGALLAV